VPKKNIIKHRLPRCIAISAFNGALHVIEQAEPRRRFAPGRPMECAPVQPTVFIMRGPGLRLPQSI